MSTVYTDKQIPVQANQSHWWWCDVCREITHHAETQEGVVCNECRCKDD